MDAIGMDTYRARWMVRRDMPEVLEAERLAGGLGWSELQTTQPTDSIKPRREGGDEGGEPLSVTRPVTPDENEEEASSPLSPSGGAGGAISSPESETDAANLSRCQITDIALQLLGGTPNTISSLNTRSPLPPPRAPQVVIRRRQVAEREQQQQQQVSLRVRNNNVRGAGSNNRHRRDSYSDSDSYSSDSYSSYSSDYSRDSRDRGRERNRASNRRSDSRDSSDDSDY